MVVAAATDSKQERLLTGSDSSGGTDLEAATVVAAAAAMGSKEAAVAAAAGWRRWLVGGDGRAADAAADAAVTDCSENLLPPWFDPRSHCLGVVGPQPGSRGNPANPGVITGNRMPQLRTLSGRLIGGGLNRGSRWAGTILLDISAHGRKVGMLSQGWLPSAEHFCWRWVGMGLKQTKKVDGHLVRKNKEPGWMATSSARTKSQSNRLTRRRCPCPSISIDNVPALRVYPSRSLEALGRLFRAKVILGRPRLG